MTPSIELGTYIHTETCGHKFVAGFFLSFFVYRCSDTVVSIFPPPPTLSPTPLWLCACVLYTYSLMTLPYFPHYPLPPPPLWLLSACFLFQCL